MLELLATTSPDAKAGYKAAINGSLPRFDVNEVFSSAITSNGREGMRSFLAHEEPNWGPLESLSPR